MPYLQTVTLILDEQEWDAVIHALDDRIDELTASIKEVKAEAALDFPILNEHAAQVMMSQRFYASVAKAAIIEALAMKE